MDYLLQSYFFNVGFEKVFLEMETAAPWNEPILEYELRN